MDQIPIATRRAKLALWTALILSIIDFGLSLVNFGFTSLFIGLITAIATIIHISTRLIVIRIRENRALKAAANTLPNRVDPADPPLLPPTSNLGSIRITVVLIIFYLVAFGISVWGAVTTELDSLVNTVGYFDAAFELLCVSSLVWLLHVGIKERKYFLEVWKRIRLKDIQFNAITARR